jgi:hypothetical protein
MALSLIVPHKEMQRCAELLHREFFQQVDPAVFAESQEPVFQSPQPFSSYVDFTDREAVARIRRVPLTPVSQN